MPISACLVGFCFSLAIDLRLPLIQRMSNSVCKENLHSSGPATDSRFTSVNAPNVLTFSHLEQIGSLLVEHRTPCSSLVYDDDAAVDDYFLCGESFLTHPTFFPSRRSAQARAAPMSSSSSSSSTRQLEIDKKGVCKGRGFCPSLSSLGLWEKSHLSRTYLHCKRCWSCPEKNCLMRPKRQKEKKNMCRQAPPKTP